jgi:hypothetical protein
MPVLGDQLGQVVILNLKDIFSQGVDLHRLAIWDEILKGCWAPSIKYSSSRSSAIAEQVECFGQGRKRN